MHEVWKLEDLFRCNFMYVRVDPLCECLKPFVDEVNRIAIVVIHHSDATSE